MTAPTVLDKSRDLGTPQRESPTSAEMVGGRRPGMASGIARLMATDRPVEQPEWSKAISYQMPTWGGDVAQAPQQGSAQTGFPIRAGIDLMGDDGLGQTFGRQQQPADLVGAGRSLLAEQMGMAPGQQRGGFYNGIATAPITLANFPTYGREGAIALLTSIMGKDYQQPEGGLMGDQPTGPTEGRDIVDDAITGLRRFGDVVNAPFDAANQWWNNSNNLNRAKQVRELAATGRSTPFVIDWVVSSVFPDGQDKWSYQRLTEEAARRQVDVVDMISTAYDLDPRIVAQILANPTMSDQQLGEMTDGQPISLDPIVALGNNAAFFLGTLAVGGGALKASGTGIRALTGGSGAIDAFGAALSGQRAAEATGIGARALGLAGTATRGVLKANALMTTTGWTIRGLELGVKQAAGILGNQDVAEMMDRLLWQMPLSMNPGLNLIDGFHVGITRPWTAARIVRGKARVEPLEVSIGRKGASYVGGVGVDDLGRYVRVGGRIKRLGRDSDAMRAVDRLTQSTPEELHASFFARLGFSFADMDRAFGPGNLRGLTWDDARNTVLALALQAVRDAKGELGRWEGMELPTLRQRSDLFWERNAHGAMRVLDDEMSGRGTAIADLVRGQFWALDKLNDSDRAAAKARLTESFVPDIALSDMVSWTAASKMVRKAIEEGRLPDGSVIGYRGTVNLDFLGAFRQHLADRYRSGDTISPADVEMLKRYGGAIEGVGKGSLLRKVRGRRQRTFTRSEVEAIIADVEARTRQQVADADPRIESPAFKPGRGVGDAYEESRVLNVPVEYLDVIRKARETATEELRQVPQGLLEAVARETGRTAAGIAAKGPAEAWQAVFDWMDDVLGRATETAAMRDQLTAFGQQVAEMPDVALRATSQRSVARIVDELLNPLTRESREQRPAHADRWDAAAEEARVLVGDVEAHLADQRRNLRPVRSGDVTWATTDALPGDALSGIDAIARRVAADGSAVMSDGDRAMLGSDAHPLAKLDALQRSMQPRDEAALLRVLQDAGLTAEGAPEALLGDMRSTLGLDDSTAGADVLAQASEAAAAYARETDDLAARAQLVADRFATVEGSLTDEVQALQSRIEVYGSRRMSRQRGYNPYYEDLDPAAAPQRLRSAALRQAEQEHARATAALDAAQADMASSMDGPVRWEAAPGTMPDGTPLSTVGTGRSRSWKADAKRAEATNRANDIRRETGLPVRVVNLGRGVWEVQVGRHGEAPAAMRPTVAATTADLAPMLRQQAIDRGVPAVPLDDVEASLRLLYTEPDAIAFMDAVAPIARGLTQADDAYLVALRSKVEDRLARLEADGGAAGPSYRQALVDIQRMVEREQAAREGAAPPVTDGVGEAAIVPEAAVVSGDTLPDAPQPVVGEGALDSLASEAAAREEAVSTQQAAAEAAARESQVAAGTRGADVSFPDPRDVTQQVPATYRLVDVSDILTSDMEGYPRDLQPRDRAGRKASDAQIEEFIRTFEPSLAFRQESGAHGPAVIGADGVALTGNGRTMAMRQMGDAQWQAYTDMLRSRAEAFGLDPDAVGPRTVLVREVAPEYMTPDMALALNSEARGMTPAELAVAIARMATPEDVASMGDIGSKVALRDALKQASKTSFVMRILDNLPPAEKGEWLDKNGMLSSDGADLISNAMLARVIPDAELIGRLVDHPEVGARFRNGVEMALAQVLLGESRLSIAGQAAEPIGPTLALAMRKILDRLDKGMRPEDMMGDMVTMSLENFMEPTPIADGLAYAMLDAGSQDRIARLLRAYGEATEKAMMVTQDGAAIPSLSQRLNAGIDALNVERMLDKIPRIPEADGTTIHPTVDTAGSLGQARDVPVTGTVAETVAAVAPAIGYVEGFDPVAILASLPAGRFRWRLPKGSDAEAMRRWLAGDDSAWQGDVVRHMADDSGTVTLPNAPPPEWLALREALRGREVDVLGATEPLRGSVPTTVLLASEVRDVRPDFAEAAGFVPDVTAGVEAVRALADTGATVVVPPTDPVTASVARTAIGAPPARDPAVVLLVNEPDAATVLRVRQEALDAAQARHATATKALDDARAEAGMQADAPLDATTLDLWDRYVGGTRHAATIRDVFDVLESIDHGAPPDGAISPAEVVQLRNSLLAASHRRLDGLGAPRTNARGREFRPDPARMAQNADLGAEYRLVDEEIQRRLVTDDAGPLDGWEGTQYEVVPAPKRYDESGTPLSPRILPDDYLSRLDDVVPGIRDEIEAGRVPTWTNRIADTHSSFLMRAIDHVVGARSERELTARAIDSFTEELMSHLPEGDVSAADMARMRREVRGAIAHVHERMLGATAGWGGFMHLPDVAKYRRVGQVPRDLLERWLMEAFDAESRPPWLDAMLADAKGERFPLAEAWRKADNRVRGYFAGMDRPIARWVEAAYSSGLGKYAHDQASRLTVLYNVYRFAFDARWLALEKTDAFALALGREGWGAVADARRQMTPDMMPLAFGPDDLARARTEWAWWLGVMDTGGWNRSRERYIISMMRRRQMREFPDILKEMVDRERGPNGEPGPLAQAIAEAGETPEQWLGHLSRDISMIADRGRFHPEPEMRARLQPYLDDGIISTKEFDDAVARGYWSDIPALDAEVAKAAGTVYEPLVRRLAFLNQQYWQDYASMVFGQVDRSNLQRLLNHPMLYWPISYQVKATKWLASMMFEQMGGYRTGALGAVTLGRLHDQHRRWMRDVEGYGTSISANRQLLFFAQMLLPITPWDIGVSLSPFTRLALSFVTGDGSYTRNLFGVGPGYTYFDLLPRLLREQSQPGSLAQGIPVVADIVRRAQDVFPFKVGVDPVTSQSQAADASTFARQPTGQTPYQQPDVPRFAP